MNKISGALKKFFLSVLPKHKTFSKIVFHKSVVQDIINFARVNYPKEFIALLEGKASDETLFVTGLLYQPYEASHRSASVHLNLPMVSGAIGSVHSHPSHNSWPSSADLEFFNKRGYLHCIISYPYTSSDLVVYDNEGNELIFEIK